MVRFCSGVLLLVWLSSSGGTPAHAATPEGLRLYALDCGQLSFKDMGFFSDTGEYDGKPGQLAATCYLVRHPKGILLWDLGLGDNIAATPGGIDVFNGAIHESVAVTMASQLAALSLAPKDITYIAFSHLHADHAGNANLFAAASTWLVNRRELAWATATPAPFGVDPQVFSEIKTARVQAIDGDLDVFGDGSVTILATPGHTPGHQVLRVRLKTAGTVILSGDLYHTRDNHTQHRVPAFNANRAETLASFDRIDKIIANEHARFVVQHSLEDFASLPKFPNYLE